VGITLFTKYVLAVEIASMLLLAGLVGAYHVGRRFRLSEPETADIEAADSEAAEVSKGGHQ